MEKKLKWLMSNEEFNVFTNNGEWDVIMFGLWENGIICPSHAQSIFESARFEYAQTDCPSCKQRNDNYTLKNGGYKCKNCDSKFSLTSGTFLDNTKLDYYIWWRFAYLVGEMGITNSCVIAKDLKVTDSTAWAMLNTLRTARKSESTTKFLNGSSVLTFNYQHEVIDVLLKKKSKRDYVIPKFDAPEKTKKIENIEEFMEKKLIEKKEAADKNYNILFHKIQTENSNKQTTNETRN